MDGITYKLFVIGLIITFVGFYFIMSYVSDKKLESLIKHYYFGKKIESVFKFNLSEKVKYAIPVNQYFHLISKPKLSFNLNGNYYRILDFTDNPNFVNVHIVVRRKKIISITEFTR